MGIFPLLPERADVGAADRGIRTTGVFSLRHLRMPHIHSFLFIPVPFKEFTSISPPVECQSTHNPLTLSVLLKSGISNRAYGLDCQMCYRSGGRFPPSGPYFAFGAEGRVQTYGQMLTIIRNTTGKHGQGYTCTPRRIAARK